MGIADIRETISSCKHCFMCRHACPTFLATKLDSHTPRGYALLLAEIEAGKLGWSDAVVDRFYQCTQCGVCREDCAYHWPEDGLVRNAREDIVGSGSAPERVLKIARNLIDSGSPVDAAPPVIENVSVGKAGAGTLYYSGWSARAFYPAVVQSTGLLLNRLGEDWTMLERETDTGVSLFELGFTREAHAQATALRDEIMRIKPRRIVTGCAHGYRAFTFLWKGMGVELDPGIEIMHTSQLLSRSVDRGAITEGGTPIEGPIGYHDPCHLARNAGVFMEPRRVIKALTGKDPIELFHNRQQAECCGAGSVMFLSDPDISLKIAERRLSGALDEGIKTLVTACPNCRILFERAAERSGIGVRMVDIVELMVSAQGTD
jgi:heterodisulfide reductase subunit D